MKKIVFAVSAVIVMGLVGTVDANAKNIGDKAVKYSAEFSHLSKYLGLGAQQSEEVYNIMEFFNEQQSSMDVTKDKALKNNLKLMKSALTPEQYRKYLTLLNVTKNNTRTDKAVDAVKADGMLASNE